MVNAPPVVFYGGSGYAAQVADHVESWEPAPLCKAVAYIDDFRGDDGSRIGDAPVISFATWEATLRDVPVFVTIADPSARRRLVERVRAAGGRFTTFYSASFAARRIHVGDDCIVVSHSFVGPDTVVGSHVHIMLLAHVDAGCVIGDFVTICPSSTIWGPWLIEDGVFIGVGARIVNESEQRLSIGAGAVIAAGAVVTRSVRPGEKLIGNPATDFRSLAAARRLS